MAKKKRKAKPALNDVLIIAKQNKAGIRMARKLERMLKPHVQSIHFDRSTALRLRQRGLSVRKFDGDLVITVGGDGTLLWTAHQTHLPILPVKIEGLAEVFPKGCILPRRKGNVKEKIGKPISNSELKGLSHAQAARKIEEAVRKL